MHFRMQSALPTDVLPNLCTVHALPIHICVIYVVNTHFELALQESRPANMNMQTIFALI